MKLMIVGVGQIVDLASGDMRNQLQVQDDSGQVHMIATSEDTVQTLIQLVTGTRTLAKRDPEPVYEDQEGVYFSAAPEVAPEVAPAIGALIEESPQEAPAPTGLGHGVSLDSKGYPVRGRSRHVDKDEYGYPIVPKQDAPALQAQPEDEEDPGEQI